jgi:hypothetical protein
MGLAAFAACASDLALSYCTVVIRALSAVADCGRGDVVVSAGFAEAKARQDESDAPRV